MTIPFLIYLALNTCAAALLANLQTHHPNLTI